MHQLILKNIFGGSLKDNRKLYCAFLQIYLEIQSKKEVNIVFFSDKVNECIQKQIQFFKIHMYSQKIYSQLMFKFYTFWSLKTAIKRVLMTFRLKNITVDSKIINFCEGQQLEKSGIIIRQYCPTLLLPCGRQIIECLPIIQYLNKFHPHPHNLFPGTYMQRLDIRIFCTAIVSLYPNQHHRLQLTDFMSDHDDSHYCFKRYSYEYFLAQVNKLINLYNKGSPYVFGTSLTAADLYFYSSISAIKEFQQYQKGNQLFKDYQNIERLYQNLSQSKEFKNYWQFDKRKEN